MFRLKEEIILLTIILFISFVKISNCQIAEYNKRLSGGEVINKNFKEVIPFTFTTQGHICIKAKINEFKDDYIFVLDSYSPCLFSESLANNLKLDILDLTKELGKLESPMMKPMFPKCETIRIGNVYFKDIGGFIMPDGKDNPLKAITENGIIGSNLLKCCIWQLNFQDTIIVISDQLKKLEHVQDAIKIPFKPESIEKFPNIQVIVNEKDTLDIQFDIGAPKRVLTINAPSLLKQIESDERNTGKSNFVKLKSLKIGLKSFYDIPAKIFKKEDKRISTNGNIGLGFLKHFIITIDWLQNNMYLSQFEDVN
jgi:hypothetical protein